MAASVRCLAYNLLNLRLMPASTRLVHTQATPLYFHASDILWATPMKKKKKTDVQIVVAREQKKKKKIEKQIKRLEKYAQKLKPVDEILISHQLRTEAKMRRRQQPVISFEESESRVHLHKAWTKYQVQKYHEDKTAIASAENAQEMALAELRKESEELYQLAIKVDEELVPFHHQGPVRTMPIPDYEAPDGEYKDTSRKWD